tara:strand:- start:352 stop:2907 length:2556 start_codon:yes stop_codon:yes gene_type:complete
MSLFKSREWWSTTCGENEAFDMGCLAIGNVDDSETGESKIVVGSFSGVVRVYKPSKRGESSVDDLILEQNLRAPVLQLVLGDFGVNDEHGEARTSIAVLHPNKVSIFSVNVEGEQNASYHSLQMEYELQLKSPLANFTTGPFIGKPYDGICVQSMDGKLSVFDSAVELFNAQLPDFLIPGPLSYCPRLDAFITVNSRFEMEKYAMRSFGSSGSKNSGNSGEHQSSTLTPDWKVCLGEGVTQITSASGFSDAVVLGKNGQPAKVELIALGERTLFVVNEFGTMIIQKRLDYVPSTMHAFRVNPQLQEQSPSHVFIADQTGAGMVYKGSRTVWAAKFEQAPCALLAGARFGGVDGMLVTLSEYGNLGVQYLGAASPVDVVKGYETAKDVGFQEMELERQKLAAVIKLATSGSTTEPADFISLRVKVPETLDPQSNTNSEDVEKTLTVDVHVTYSGTGSIHDVALSIHAPSPAECRQESFVVPAVHGGSDTPTVVPVVLRVPKGSGVPGDNIIRVVAGYRVKGTGEPRVAVTDSKVPLSLWVDAAPPVKLANYKITLDTNRPPPANICDLFRDIVDAPSSKVSTQDTAGGNVVSFTYGDGSDCTIIVSKNAGRYRLQSSKFEALWVVLEELKFVLEGYYGGADGNGDEPTGDSSDPFSISFNEALPLQDFFSVVDSHHLDRQRRSISLQNLSDKARSFRAVQKRLLIKFKDKNPVVLSHLDALLEGAFVAVTSEATETELAESELKNSSVSLAAATQTCVLLIALRFQLNSDDLKTLRAYLSPKVVDTPEMGWAEWTEAATTTLLKTKLAKGGDRTTGGVHGTGQPLPLLQDTSKLKKHVSVVCERLARGAKLA